MALIYFKCVPFSKEEVTLALESGVDGVIVPRDAVESVAHLSRLGSPEIHTPWGGNGRIGVTRREGMGGMGAHKGVHIVHWIVDGLCQKACTTGRQKNQSSFH